MHPEGYSGAAALGPGAQKISTNVMATSYKLPVGPHKEIKMVGLCSHKEALVALRYMRETGSRFPDERTAREFIQGGVEPPQPQPELQLLR
ncbi:hypothetical protein A2643_02775 [Candidatus Nomurabacteria bacterium RIFCSPHIGHO2_01_FULL_39_220]|uniref:Uncharacterized protein n=1 Tax=Candidatus Nomurabacteria bacterium RIFCSPLOWO2_02_FULL_40_67 TaxID=1801787 RepID=A0A1F6Y393_9BACT|nr:MAG: hypothetical protein A2W12_04075 [Candidatus Nomurabacteria bacterium RBG_16_40_11]OGI69622.1 MAG: hypothetical protein A2643_02775 [Candidatus Nomurabacteria bacterium RIFCSPHIGHO2_01_FULL_39_220]OGJ00816.1 MAG: hypothetical protein A3I23_01750 [Candidatus Nomurabacteria bacterium RIFCSPLOWO2_02_FULL_40_67]OGJ02793.1 MAG: hypothetical protein A3G48_03240 [Candidatus Nomurabacteria bacterium RIFCSPLOWO2_12_FULL_40_42]